MKHTSCRLSDLSNELKSNGDPFVRATRVGEIPIEGTLVDRSLCREFLINSLKFLSEVNFWTDEHIRDNGTFNEGENASKRRKHFYLLSKNV